MEQGLGFVEAHYASMKGAKIPEGLDIFIRDIETLDVQGNHIEHGRPNGTIKNILKKKKMDKGKERVEPFYLYEIQSF